MIRQDRSFINFVSKSLRRSPWITTCLGIQLNARFNQLASWLVDIFHITKFYNVCGSVKFTSLR